jgi:hypothetical protein
MLKDTDDDMKDVETYMSQQTTAVGLYSNSQDATRNTLQHKTRYTLPFVTQHHDITPLINLQQEMVTPFIFS